MGVIGWSYVVDRTSVDNCCCSDSCLEWSSVGIWGVCAASDSSSAGSSSPNLSAREDSDIYEESASSFSITFARSIISFSVSKLCVSCKLLWPSANVLNNANLLMGIS
jgi:hypothetical protein